LTDTYGSDFFFDYFDERTARNWKGVRHDSGCPFEFGNKLLFHYMDIGIDPKDKLLIFSDGLDLDTICKLYEQFKNKINLSFGWGTNLTNDTGIKPLNIVVKMTKAGGIGTVKLSDNIAKAMGSAEDIKLFREVCC
jgi:nicotinate phosphoribosyltransferase